MVPLFPLLSRQSYVGVETEDRLVHFPLCPKLSCQSYVGVMLWGLCRIVPLFP